MQTGGTWFHLFTMYSRRSGELMRLKQVTELWKYRFKAFHAVRNSSNAFCNLCDFCIHPADTDRYLLLHCYVSQNLRPRWLIYYYPQRINILCIWEGRFTFECFLWSRCITWGRSLPLTHVRNIWRSPLQTKGRICSFRKLMNYDPEGCLTDQLTRPEHQAILHLQRICFAFQAATRMLFCPNPQLLLCCFRFDTLLGAEIYYLLLTSIKKRCIRLESPLASCPSKDLQNVFHWPLKQQQVLMGDACWFKARMD